MQELSSHRVEILLLNILGEVIFMLLNLRETENVSRTSGKLLACVYMLESPARGSRAGTEGPIKPNSGAKPRHRLQRCSNVGLSVAWPVYLHFCRVITAERIIFTGKIFLVFPWQITYCM